MNIFILNENNFMIFLGMIPVKDYQIETEPW